MTLLLMSREDVDGTPALVLVQLTSFQKVASSHHHHRHHLVNKDRKGREPHPYPIALDLALVRMTLNHLALVRAGSVWRGEGSRGLLRRAAW